MTAVVFIDYPISVQLTEHSLRDWEGDSRPASHSPARGQIRKVSTQHLHNHPVIKGQVKLLVINKLPGVVEKHKQSHKKMRNKTKHKHTH